MALKYYFKVYKEWNSRWCRETTHEMLVQSGTSIVLPLPMPRSDITDVLAVRNTFNPRT